MGRVCSQWRDPQHSGAWKALEAMQRAPGSRAIGTEGAAAPLPKSFLPIILCFFFSLACFLFYFSYFFISMPAFLRHQFSALTCHGMKKRRCVQASSYRCSLGAVPFVAADTLSPCPCVFLGDAGRGAGCGAGVVVTLASFLSADKSSSVYRKAARAPDSHLHFLSSCVHGKASLTPLPRPQ